MPSEQKKSNNKSEEPDDDIIVIEDDSEPELVENSEEEEDNLDDALESVSPSRTSEGFGSPLKETLTAKKSRDLDAYVNLRIELKNCTVIDLEMLESTNVSNVKWALAKRIDVPPKKQRLFFEGMELDEPEYALELYGINYALGKSLSGDDGKSPHFFRMKMEEVYDAVIQTYFLDERLFDHKWTCSFEGIERAKDICLAHARGGRPYRRPIGSVRYGINVLHKYDNGNNNWLGLKGFRTEKEWPVAYHGTKELNVLDIIREGLRLDKCVRFAYGKGIYCSPDPATALAYGQDYMFEAPDGSRKYYKLILQCRVDPAKLQIVANHGSTGIGEYWLVPDGSAIRPYGVCAYPTDARYLPSQQFLSMVQQPPQRVIAPSAGAVGGVFQRLLSGFGGGGGTGTGGTGST